MKPIGIFIVAILVWLMVHIEIDSHNPCSSFSKRPELCDSDYYERMA